MMRVGTQDTSASEVVNPGDEHNKGSEVEDHKEETDETLKGEDSGDKPSKEPVEALMLKEPGRESIKNPEVKDHGESILPPYPCNEVCAHCGKTFVDTMIYDELRHKPSKTFEDCTCICHQQDQEQFQKLMIAQTHNPPGGPNCLPGCGYSGLPCYNCTSFQNHLQAKEETAMNISQGLPSQICTVDLLNPASSKRNQYQWGKTSQEHRRKRQAEDNLRTKRMIFKCFWIIIFIINVAIAIFAVSKIVTAILNSV